MAVDEDAQRRALVLPEVLILEKVMGRLETCRAVSRAPARLLEPLFRIGDPVLEPDAVLVDLGPSDVGGQVYRDQRLPGRCGEMVEESAVEIGWPDVIDDR